VLEADIDGECVTDDDADKVPIPLDDSVTVDDTELVPPSDADTVPLDETLTLPVSLGEAVTEVDEDGDVLISELADDVTDTVLDVE
jgi:hypothetical protein